MNASTRIPPTSLLPLLTCLLVGFGTAGCKTPALRAVPEDRTDAPLWFDEDSFRDDNATPAPALGREWIAVPRTVWTDQLGIVTTHLNEAYQAYNDKAPRRCALSLRRAAAQIVVEAARSEGAQKMALEMAKRELQGLANAIDNDRQLDDDTLRTAFSHAHYGLALHHAEKAWLFAEQAQNRKLALALQASSDNLLRSWHWLNLDTRKSSRDAVTKVRNTARDLLAGTSRSAEYIEEMLELLDAELVYTGLQIAPQAE